MTREEKLEDALVSLLGMYEKFLYERGETHDIFTAKAIRALDPSLSVNGAIDGAKEPEPKQWPSLAYVIVYLLGVASAAVVLL